MSKGNSLRITFVGLRGLFPSPTFAGRVALREAKGRVGVEETMAHWFVESGFTFSCTTPIRRFAPPSPQGGRQCSARLII